MKLFISWSGKRSQRIGHSLYDSLEAFLQGTEPFFSPEGIEKGASWFDTLSRQLGETNFGIICLTPENRLNPWLLFEAGALAKHIKAANVCPVLFGLTPDDIEGPLAQFQLTSFTKADIERMCGTINSRLERKLGPRPFATAFEAFWTTTDAVIRECQEINA